MSDMVQETFDLSHPPFDKGVKRDQMWLDPARERGLKRLVTTVTQRQHALVTGESGIGKTCVTGALEEELSPVHFRIHYVVHVTLAPRDFYRQLCYAMSIEPKATPAAMFEAIQRECIACAAEHRAHAVLILDEAHLMPDSTLSHLHLLANFRRDSEPLLSLVLVGLPELYDRLRLGIHRSLLTRIHTRVELAPGSPEATAAYVRKRLADAGARHELFTADGLATLHEFTGGLLRSIDVLALAALRLAATDDLRLVDREVVRKALHHTPLG
ncbi:MAG: general secretion pathway protein GspA [Deltaproteobacteria bacterium]|nr:general secretion pathway protein GspA [Deltaproteobacteria bacterium]